MRGRTRRHFDIWPGYVDVLSTLLMVIIFTLMVFVIGQFVLSQVLSGRERKLAELSQQLASLGDMLAMEKTTNTDLRSTIAQLTQQLAQVTATRSPPPSPSSRTRPLKPPMPRPRPRPPSMPSSPTPTRPSPPTRTR